MGKRSNFKRFKQDAYDTPPEAVIPLLPFLLDETEFVEPCAGKGHLIDHLKKHGHKCMYGSDITPGRDDIYAKDVFDLTGCDANCFITNPPWTRPTLHKLIPHLSQFAPTWLLLDSDYMHTKQAVPYLARCQKIVSIGRVKWIPDSKHTGKDNCCWYLFGNYKCEPTFYGRTP
jgi:hypothetical protein